ncbi:MAG: type II secretion system protein GspL [Pseudomonadota bacterium]|nr:type II secretion system protein GspL [Pseudomonadota bacterium]
MLYVWIPEGNAAWRWRVVDDHKTKDHKAKHPQDQTQTNTTLWQSAENWEALLQATQAEQQREVTVFFPTASAQLLQRPMSRAQRRQLGDQGVRYLLEEYTLGSVEQLDVRDQIIGEDQLSIVAVPSSHIAQYVHAMALGSWQVQALLPDFLLLPLYEQRATLWLGQQTPILRLNAATALSAEDLSVVLPRLTTVTGLTVLGQPNPQQQAALDQSDLPIEYLDQHLILPEQTTRHPFNFLPKAKGVQLSPYWKVLAASVLLAVLVQVIHDGLTAWRYQQVANATQQQAEQQFRQWFPDEQRIINLRRQMEGRLQGGNEQDVMALMLIGRVGPVLQQAQLVAQSVRYRDEVLELNVVANHLSALEELKNQFNQQGLNAELGSVNPVGSEVAGLIRVRP